jgi:integrase/recombinase XerC
MPSGDDFYAYLFHQKKYSEHTVGAYQRDIREFEDYLRETYGLSTVTEADDPMIRSWLASLMEKGLRATSIKRKKASINSFYRFLLKSGKIKKIPGRYVKTPKTDRPLPAFIPTRQLNQLFETDFFEIRKFEDLQNRMIVETFYATGIRVSELVSLKDSSFDTENKSLKVLGKRKKERIIPIHRIFCDMIHHFIQTRNKEFIQVKTDDSFFLTKKGKNIYRKLAYRVIISYLSSVTSMKKKSPHVMRHTFATHLLNEGSDINALKDMLGHSSLAATQFYTHNTIEQLKNVYKNTHPKSQKRRKL